MPGALTVAQLACERAAEPMAVASPAPRLSWVAASDRRGAVQTGHHMLVASRPDLLEPGRADLWDSGAIDADAVTHVLYAGVALDSARQCHWRVRVRDEEGDWSDWSATARFETAPATEAWRSAWISAPPAPFERDGYRPAPYFRTEFELTAPVVRARAYATALGLYHLHINGHKVGAERLAPGWVDYAREVEFQVHDVTELLRVGGNAIGIVLGDGWYAGYMYLPFTRETYGAEPKALAALVVELEDGSTVRVATDGSWRWSYGPILSSDMLLGEVYDARRELTGWDAPGFDASAWQSPVPDGDQGIELVPARCEPVLVTECLAAAFVGTPTFQTHVYDFGQNLVGWVRLELEAPEGAEIVIRHGEALDADGTVYTANLRRATSVDRYIARGGGPEVFEPAFTFHGFRYVEIVGPDEPPEPSTLTAMVAHTAMPETGSFSCSSELVNRLQSNIRWSQRGNSLHVPTDCPQRNERLGWLGDARIFSRTACFNYDTANFYVKWLEDVLGARTADGIYNDVAPRVPWKEHDGAPGWADGGVFIPWTVYWTYDDVRVLERHFEPMTRYLEAVRAANPALIREHRLGRNWGDWLSVPEPDRGVGRETAATLETVWSTTPKEVFATALFAQSATIVSRSAEVLGKDADAERYAALAADVRRAFAERFVDADGRIHGDTQTCYALAICFDLVPDVEAAGRHLLAAVERHGGRLSTGISGTELLLPALTRIGALDVAYRVLLNEDYPSWGYTIANGATTIWERWDGWTAEAGFQDQRMNSLNHYAFGSVGAWMYETIGGIEALAPGWSRIRIRPRPGGGIDTASVSYRSVRGDVAASWAAGDEGFFLDVQIPPSTQAAVHLPASGGAAVSEGGVALGDAPGVLGVRQTDAEVVIDVAAGRYSFAVRG